MQTQQWQSGEYSFLSLSSTDLAYQCCGCTRLVQPDKAAYFSFEQSVAAYMVALRLIAAPNGQHQPRPPATAGATGLNHRGRRRKTTLKKVQGWVSVPHNVGPARLAPLLMPCLHSHANARAYRHTLLVLGNTFRVSVYVLRRGMVAAPPFTSNAISTPT